MNEMDLYAKVQAEQSAFVDWLLQQPANVILDHAYEYAMREDILLSMEHFILTEEQEAALMSLDKPLEALCDAYINTENAHMEEVWDSVEQFANDEINRQLEAKLKQKKVYPHSVAHAQEHGELEQYRDSYRANIACSKAIDAAIREHYRDNRLDPAAVTQVVERFGMERTLFVLAATARYKDRDARIGDHHKVWAQSIPVPDDRDARGADRTHSYVVGYAHPGLVNLFMNEARKRVQEQQPSIHQQLQQKPDAPAKKPLTRKEPQR